MDAALNSADAVKREGARLSLAITGLVATGLLGFYSHPLQALTLEQVTRRLLNAFFPVSGNTVSPTHLAAAKAGCSHACERAL